ncbi:MAG: hypothetical protein C4319_04300 [Acidimicrobiia bacterium]
MRVCLAIPYFPPELGAASVRAKSMLSAFEKAGHEVVIVTPKPSYFLEHQNYGHGENRYWRPSDSEGLGSKKIQVHHTLLPLRAGGDGLGTRLILELFASFLAVPAVTKAARGCDLVFTSSPPLTYALASAVAGRLARAKVAVEVRDVWPDIIFSALVEERSRAPLVRGLGFIGRLLSHVLYKLAFVVVCVTRSDTRRLSGSLGNKKPVLYAPNGADEEAIAAGELLPHFDSNRKKRSRFKIAYAGRLGPAQKVSTLLEAASRIEYPMEITIIGSGPERQTVQRIANQQRRHLVSLLDPLPRKKVLEILAEQDAIYVPLASKSIVSSVPSKLFEAWALGIPVVVAAAGEAAQIVNEVAGGVVAMPDNPHSIARAIEALCTDLDVASKMGANGRNSVLQKFCRDKIMAELVRTLTEAVAAADAHPT